MTKRQYVSIQALIVVVLIVAMFAIYKAMRSDQHSCQRSEFTRAHLADQASADQLAGQRSLARAAVDTGKVKLIDEQAATADFATAINVGAGQLDCSFLDPQVQ